MSFACLEEDDWKILHAIIPKHMNIELNISCPNVNEHPNLKNYFALDKRKWCIVKVPPTITQKQLDKIISLGYNSIHASNTIPTEKGGLSGKMIMPYTLKIIDYIKSNYRDIKVIAGGGVYSKQDANKYLDAGADHISLGSVCFTPWKIKGIIND